MQNSSSLAEEIRKAAEELGFVRTGFTRAGPLPGSERLDEWLRRGMHGEMHYLERQADRRRDPSRVFAGVRTIITVALNYYAAAKQTNDPGLGRISRYAWGEDYHVLAGRRLEQLLASIRQLAPGSTGICHVDTGPVMEKTWAALSSIGWLGKNANVITRKQGSWFFLGALLVDVDLESDVPEADRCGTCSRCLAACPTGAIVAPHVVDARRCISYLTIELRGVIPRSLRPLIGNRIFGCDDCQDVCPWNRFAVETAEQGFHPAAGNLMPELAALAGLSSEEFRRRFRNSPVSRAKRDGFVRNVVVALGNSGTPAAVPPLAGAMADESPLVRLHAAWALGRLGTPEALEVLEASRAHEPDSGVLSEIAAALPPAPGD